MAEKKGSNVVDPIKSKEDIEKMKDYLMKESYRDYMIYFLGINVFLRISDLLNLKRSSIIGEYLLITEEKTGKTKRQKLHPTVLNELETYFRHFKLGPNDYLFTSKSNKNKPLSRVSGWKILSEAAEEVGLKNIGSHSLRKTFGYHYFQETKDIETLRMLFNHSSHVVTRRYIGLTQEHLDNVTSSFLL